MEFLLPDIGEGVAEGEIVKWHVAPGQEVVEEQDFVEVMTDKATVMIPCPVTGVVGELLAQEGDVVPVHTPIATFAEVREGKLAGAHGSAAAQGAQRAAQGSASASSGGASPSAGTALLERPQERVRATPATRKAARERGLDIRRIQGTGPHGRVTREDVERAARSASGGNGRAASAPRAPARADAPAPRAPAPVAAPRSAPAPLPAPTPLPAPGADEPEERVPLRGVRRKIAEFLQLSKRTAAHYTYVEEVDVTELVALRARMKPLAAERGAKLTYLAFIVKAVCHGLKQHPELNASLDEASSELVFKRYYHIGIAADTEQGLTVPVLRHADRRSLLDIAREIARLAEGTRSGTLRPEELSGSTFTITSAGHIGGLLATPILNYPEVGILGVHKIKKRPVVVDDQIAIRDIMYLSLSLDHRVVDGANAARFMNTVVQYLEDPQLLLLEGI
ncbi:MAG: 2-oxo acid dehydrogenase subunit E2 [Planctomycetota bacterium]|nr:MAG: 2-oxo acid dehydrogenase subunit E2 [Planctomycetota bacterium]